MTTGKRRYLVFNVTDGVVAHPDLLTRGEAQTFVRRFPSRFARQGYYLTASRERISAEAVELAILDTDAAPPVPCEPTRAGSQRRW